MASPAKPYSEMFQLAAAAFAEGRGALEDTNGLNRDAVGPVLAYAHQAITSGFLQLEACAKRYANERECNGAANRPILGDPQFRAAVIQCVSQLEEAVPLLGVPAKRIAAALRRWVEDNNPAEARTLAMQCDAAARLSKTRSGRAA
jgi:hypothetical protein